MKKNDWILAAVVLLAAIAGCAFLYWNQARGHYVVVSVDGEEYGTYDLGEDRVIEIQDTNRLEIRNGKAFMIEANCPDQICVHMSAVSRTHEMIVCMPNRVTVEVFEK